MLVLGCHGPWGPRRKVTREEDGMSHRTLRCFRGRKKGKKESEKREEHREKKRVNSNISYVNVASSGQVVLKKWFIHLRGSAFFSLFLSSGRVALLLFVSLSYKFIVLGHGWTDPTTILSGLGQLVSLVLTIFMHMHGVTS